MSDLYGFEAMMEIQRLQKKVNELTQANGFLQARIKNLEDLLARKEQWDYLEE